MSASRSAATFWKWVADHQLELRAVIGESMTGEEPVLDALLEALHAYDEDLFYLMGGDPAEMVELIITAEGNLEAFPAVRKLIDAAPALPGWEFVAFKPPMGFDFVMRHERATIDGKTAWFQPLTTPSGNFGLRLACDGYLEEADDDFVYAAEMLLEAGVGELAAFHIRGIDVVRTPESPRTSGFLPLNELEDYVASRAASLPS